MISSEDIKSFINKKVKVRTRTGYFLGRITSITDHQIHLSEIVRLTEDNVEKPYKGKVYKRWIACESIRSIEHVSIEPYQLRPGEEVRDGVLYGWTGNDCSDCKGTGQRYCETRDREAACVNCGGTGEYWGVMTKQPTNLFT